MMTKKKFKEKIMLAGIMFILLAWFVELPFWLSMISTIYGGLRAIVSLVKFGITLNED